MDISHIVTIGCSFTYCQNLSIEHAWPTQLSKQLSSPLVNLGVPGIGNDAIHRKLHEYLYKNKTINNSKPFVIVAFSDPWRKEVWVKEHHIDKNFNSYAPISYPKDKPESYYEYALLENWNEHDFFRRNIIYKLSLINLFESLGVPYIFTDSFFQWGDENTYNSIKENFNTHLQIIQNKFYVESIYNIADKEKNLPCGHYGKESCEKIADFLVTQIKSLYPNLSFRNDLNYYKLRDYIHLDKYHQKFPNWCEA